ncbi:MAG: LysM peptidoglycan-binding domain-containing protein [Balneola sp.]|nr:LysM peptidoglycan-binding domain-containing protein [Balneola sp.]MBO6650216.1 LysM peptidoglycan-binding domain-containing protein [Balneola sp.]MBO6712199.1 LysM peptidoglycan-binding domain-containing protein [Balneola sp.]MBO6800393.1 LysM peptidoglycan-binding domain-containing protein [Balneola sp.]MBO6871815.1 LysM peptidoglycan-binding domain-containing protein [Balneola sp.]
MKSILNKVIKGILLSIFLVCFSNPATAQEKRTYQVKKGDTFYSISKALDVTVAELKEWNGITSNALEIDQELIYYIQSEVPAIPDSLPREDTSSLITSPSNSPNTYYLVKSGDSLYKIARENDMSVQELKDLNNLSSNDLRIGQRLAVKSVSVAPVVSQFSDESSPQGKFALYTLSASDNLNSVLDKFEMTQNELQRLNPQIDVNNLKLTKNITVLLPPSKTFENPYLEKADLQDLGSVPVMIYSDSDKGKTTTNGELYNPDNLTAAHSNISIGSIIFVENPSNGKGIYVRINDRITNPGLKLSHDAFRILDLIPNQPQSVSIYTDN